MGNDSSKTSIWDEFYQKSQKDSKQYFQDIFKVSRKQSVNIQEYIEKSTAKLTERNQALCLKIWSRYDEDKNDELSPEELKKLLKEALMKSKEWVPKFIVEMFVEGLKFGCSVHGDETTALFLVDRVNKVSDTFIALVEAELDKYIKDSETIAKRMFVAMDVNKDGKVERKEFIENYNKTFNEEVNLDKMGEVLKQMAFADLAQDPA